MSSIMFLLLILSTPVLLIWAIVRSFSNKPINENGNENSINSQQGDDDQITNPIYSYLPCNIYHNDDNISGFSDNDDNSSNSFNNDFSNNDF